MFRHNIIRAIVFIIQSVSANNNFFSLGKKIKGILDARKNKVLVSVNGIHITQQDLERTFVLQSFLYEFQCKRAIP